MCLWNKDAPSGNKVQILQNLYVLHFDPAPPPGACHVSELWGTIDELTVQVWLLYHHQNFKYCTLFESGAELRTDRRTDRRTIRFLDAPADLSGRGHKIEKPPSDPLSYPSNLHTGPHLWQMSGGPVPHPSYICLRGKLLLNFIGTKVCGGNVARDRVLLNNFNSSE